MEQRLKETLTAAHLAATQAVRLLMVHPGEPDRTGPALDKLTAARGALAREFPALRDEVEFWETLWLCAESLRTAWNRIERAAERTGDLPALQALLDQRRAELYEWTRAFACSHAPRVPQDAHFELGIDVPRPDRRGLHERIEGIYESFKRMGRLPRVVEDAVLPPHRPNFGIIYGAGWNVSAYSVLREAGRLELMNALVAFDHPGSGLYGQVGGRTVRLATAGMFQAGQEDDWALATFREPALLHFACPHEWTGPPPHELGIPVLRSELTLEITDDKLNTSRALAWHARRSGAELPLIREAGLEPAGVPADPEGLHLAAEDALSALERQGVAEVVVKPRRGEQERDVAWFELPRQRAEAAEHAARLCLESGAVVQERIRPAGGLDYNFRLLVALSPEGEAEGVGRFARLGHGDELEMVPEAEMLARAGILGKRARDLLERLSRVSLEAFRAVAGYAEHLHPDYPWRPLGGGSYAVPYILGVDLIGEAQVMEVNGNEVAGMWTDDRLYPATRGRSNRTVLRAAHRAALAYRAALGQ